MLQHESVAHVEVQRLIEERLHTEPDLAVASLDFLLWVHEQFYSRVPDELRMVAPLPRESGSKWCRDSCVHAVEMVWGRETGNPR